MPRECKAFYAIEEPGPSEAEEIPCSAAVAWGPGREALPPGGEQHSAPWMRARSHQNGLARAQVENRQTLRRGLELHNLALRSGTGALALSRLNREVVRGVGLEILDPDGVVIVAVRFLGAAPGLFGGLGQIIRVRAVANDAAAGGARGPRNFSGRLRDLVDAWAVGNALRFLRPGGERKQNDCCKTCDSNFSH